MAKVRATIQEEEQSMNASVGIESSEDSKRMSKLRAHNHGHTETKKSCGEGMAPYILMLALGIHALFEGLAVGINKESDKVQQLIVGIVLHKGAAGMSLGISMTKNLAG